MFGVLAVNKPAGWTSRDVVNRVQGRIRPFKVGHTGTLDPMATGVLLLAVGPAVRLVEFSLGHAKSYEADFILGMSSDTLDTTGKVEVRAAARAPELDEIQREIQNWIGHVQQVPPAYSAINVGGQRAYDMARRGDSFELTARAVDIYDIRIVRYEYPQLTLHIDCGSGTYVRSLGRDIADQLGTAAIMSRLVRTRIGPFELAECIELTAELDRDLIEQNLRSPQLLLAKIPIVSLAEHDATNIRNGIPLPCESCLVTDRQSPETPADIVAGVDISGALAAVMKRADNGTYRSLRVFHPMPATSQPTSTRIKHSPES
jgi:tRNA pseudouridine55 synthase